MHVYSLVNAHCDTCKKVTKHDRGFEKLDQKHYIVCLGCHTATEVPAPVPHKGTGG